MNQEDKIYNSATRCWSLQAENKNYPRFGYTVGTILENADEYITYFKADFESDMISERKCVFDWIKTWVETLASTRLVASIPPFLRGLNTFRLTYIPYTVYNGIIVK